MVAEQGAAAVGAAAVALRGEPEAEVEAVEGEASRSGLRTHPTALIWAKVSSSPFARKRRSPTSQLTEPLSPRRACLTPTAKKIKANLIANAKTKKRFFKSIAGEEGFADTKGKGRANENDDEDDGEDYDDEEERAQSSAPRRPRAGPSSRGAPSPFFQKTDLGRFAREEEDEEQGPTVDSAARLAAGDDARQRRRDRAGPAPAPDHEGRRGGDRAPPRKWGRPEELSSALPSPATAKSDPITAPAPAQVSAPRPHRTREEAVEARKKRQEMWNSTSKGGSRAQSRKGGQPDLGKRMQVLLGRIEERQQ